MTVVNIRYLVKDKKMLISVDGDPYISGAMLSDTQKVAIFDYDDSKSDNSTYFFE